MAFSSANATTLINLAARGNLKALRDLFFDLYTNGASVASRTAVVATGSTNANAAALSAGFNVVTAGDGTKGVILPAGFTVTVKNNSASILKVYPPAGAAINALTATTGALSMAANTIASFHVDGTAQVWSLPLLPS